MSETDTDKSTTKPKRRCDAHVLDNRVTGPNIRLLKLRTDGSIPAASPGQFIMLGMPVHMPETIPIPLSVYDGKSAGEISLLFSVEGERTAVLSTLREKDPVTVTGPLGTGFYINGESAQHILLAGGMGIAGVGLLMRHLTGSGHQTTLIYGGKTGEHLVDLEQCRTVCPSVYTATEDGSLGEKGFVTDVLLDTLNNSGDGSTVYACGPMPMLHAVAKITNNLGIECQVSLEGAMGCGTGACLGCAVALKGKSGCERYARTCTDGPVFNAADIDWDFVMAHGC